MDACTTRLRLEVVSQDKSTRRRCSRLGAHGLVRPSPTALQVVLGPIADQVAERIRRQLRALSTAPVVSGATAAAPVFSGVTAAAPVLSSVTAGDRSRSETTPASDRHPAAERTLANGAVHVADENQALQGGPAHEQNRTVNGSSRELLVALGGEGNVAEVTAVAVTRLRVRLHDEARLDQAALQRLAPRGTVRVEAGLWHILVGLTAASLAQDMRVRCDVTGGTPRPA